MDNLQKIEDYERKHPGYGKATDNNFRINARGLALAKCKIAGNRERALDLIISYIPWELIDEEDERLLWRFFDEL